MPGTRQSFAALYLVLDLLMITLAFAGATAAARIHIYRIALVAFNIPQLAEVFTLAVLWLAWFLASRMAGLYDEFKVVTFVQGFPILVKVWLGNVAAAAIVLFALKNIVLSRLFLLSYAGLLILLVGAEKWATRRFIMWRKRRGSLQQRLLLVGSGDQGWRFVDAIAHNPNFGYALVGRLATGNDNREDVPLLGGLERLDAMLAERTVDEVIVALSATENQQREALIATCQKYPIGINIIPDFGASPAEKYRVTLVGDLPMVTLRRDPLDEFVWRALKRLFDVGFTLLLTAVVFVWLWPIVALLVKLSSRGPVFFKQERWGQKGRRIVCYKFRTMHQGSAEVDRDGKYLQAQRHDPRVTRIGSFLRRSSVDELPQFINVLKGEMSIVGPRPHPTPLNLESIDRIERYLLRHLVKPGLTGWAQVNGLRGATGDKERMRKRVEYDLWYIENWSIWLDIQIVVLTIWHMLVGDRHAY
jgi:putative colanic acid biosysnthesis UDP-glucose lipid carrier transferase